MSRSRRWLRLVVRLVGAVTLLVVLAVLAALWIGAHLDSPSVKRRLLAQLQQHVGLEVEYQSAHFHVEGLELVGVHVAQPAADRGITPDLVALDRLDVKWGGFLGGGPLHITSVELDGLKLEVVVDETGATSLDRLFPPSPPKNTPSTPLSQLVGSLLALPVEVAAARVGATHLALHERHGAEPAAHDTLDGLTVVLHGGHAGWSLELGDGLGDSTLTWRHQELAPAKSSTVTVDFHTLVTARPRNRRDETAVVRAQVSATLRTAPFDADGCFAMGALAALHVRGHRCAGARFLPHALFELDATIEALPKQQRTQIEVTRLALLGDALTAELRGLLYDRAVDGDPLIERLHVGFDAEPLVRLWPELVEGKARASVELERFAVGWPSARFLDHGKLALSVRAPLLLVHLDRQTYRAERLGLDAHLTLPNAEHPKDRTLGLVLKSEVGKAVAELPGLRAELAGHALELRVEGLTPTNLGAAWSESSQVSAAGKLGDVVVSGAFGQLTARGIGIDGHGRAHKRVGSGTLHVPIAALAFVDGQNHAVIPTEPVDLTVEVPHVSVPPNVAATAGKATLGLRWGNLSVGVHVDRGERGGDPVKLALDLSAPDLTTAAAFVPVEQQRALGIPFAKMALAGTATVDVDLAKEAAQLGADLTITHGAALVGSVPVGFDPLALHVTGHGTSAAAHVELSTSLPHLTVGKQAEPPVAVAIVADYGEDHGATSATAKLTLRGNGLDGQVAVAGTQSKKGLWHVSSDAALTKLGTVFDLVELPAGLNLHRDLTVTFSGQGDLHPAERATKTSAAHPLALDGQVKLGLHHVDVEMGASEYRVPSLTLTGTAAYSGSGTGAGARHLDARVELDHPTGELPAVTLALDELGFRLLVDQPTAGAELTLSANADGKNFSQSVFPLYVPSDIHLDVALRGDLDGRIDLDRAHFELPQAGGLVDLAGRIELGGGPQKGVPGRRSLTLTGRIEQQLDALGNLHGKRGSEWRGQGRVKIPLAIESGDLRIFRVAASVQLKDASLAEGARIAIDGISGEIPLIQSFELADGAFVRLGGAEVGAYPKLRFADQQPFLQSGHYLSIRSLRYGDKTVGPLEGNLRIDRNVVALEHVELAAFSGRVTAQCVVDTNEKSPQLLIRGDVTGVRPSKTAEPIDANWALRVNVGARSVDGRAEIVRIGKRDLLSVLDAWDPYRTDVSANRMRKALAVGFPERVRLGFHQGFASLALDLGGLGKLFRIEPIEGLPIGPIIEQYLTPLLSPDEDQ